MSFTAMLSLLVLLFFSFINFFIRTCFHYFFLSFALISFFLFSVFLSLFLFSFACPLKLLKEFMGLNLSRKQNNSMRISTSRMLEEMTLEDKWKMIWSCWNMCKITFLVQISFTNIYWPTILLKGISNGNYHQPIQELSELLNK